MRNLTKNQIYTPITPLFKTNPSVKGKMITRLDLIALHDAMVNTNTFLQWRDTELYHKLRQSGYLEPERVVATAVSEALVRKIEKNDGAVVYYQWIKEVARPSISGPTDGIAPASPQFEWIPDPHVSALSATTAINLCGVTFTFTECMALVTALGGELQVYRAEKGVLRWNVAAGSLILDSDDIDTLYTLLKEQLVEMAAQIHQVLGL